MTTKDKKQALEIMATCYKMFERIEKSPTHIGTGLTKKLDKMAHYYIWNNGGVYNELSKLETFYEEVKRG